MNLGQWLGTYAGAWFGTVGETDPNALSGVATLRIDASGHLHGIGRIAGSAGLSIAATGAVANAEVAVSPAPTSGGGARRKRRRQPLGVYMPPWPRATQPVEDEDALCLLGMI